MLYTARRGKLLLIKMRHNAFFSLFICVSLARGFSILLFSKELAITLLIFFLLLSHFLFH